MPKIHIYVPDDLHQAVNAAGISVSGICQKALRQEVRRMQAVQQASSDLESVAARLRETRADADRRDYQDGYKLGARWAREDATVEDLDWAASLRTENWHSLTLEVDSENSLGSFLVHALESPSGMVRLTHGPFASGLLDGAHEVYEKVSPLL